MNAHSHKIKNWTYFLRDITAMFIFVSFDRNINLKIKNWTYFLRDITAMFIFVSVDRDIDLK